MELADRLSFDHGDREDIYDYVESNGPTDLDTVRRALRMDERAFGHHVAILKRDGVVETRHGKLRVAFETGAEETFEADGVEVTVRQAREEDLAGLIGAIRQGLGGGEYVEAETIADVVDSEGVLLRHNELESRIFFVATVEGEVVGWVYLKHPEIEKLSHTAELTLGVLEAYRCIGIGSRLLDRGLEWARSRGFEKIYNSVPAVNESAIEFFESRNFYEEARREDHYRIDGEYVDEVMLATALDRGS
jgi:ribosomal protein S18 acetylase RimI-like enzyme